MNEQQDIKLIIKKQKNKQILNINSNSTIWYFFYNNYTVSVKNNKLITIFFKDLKALSFICKKIKQIETNSRLSLKIYTYNNTINIFFEHNLLNKFYIFILCFERYYNKSIKLIYHNIYKYLFFRI